MSSTMDDNFLNFDTSLLHGNPDRTELESRLEKQHKAILFLKAKTLSTHAAVKHVLNSNQQMDALKKTMDIVTGKYNQACLDYNNALEKAVNLDKELEFYRNHIMELEKKLDVSETQREAIQSHANQLQQLVHSHETQIESLKIENKLTKLNKKEKTKDTYSQKCEFNIFLQDLCLFRDLLLKKKRLQSHHKIILKKYEKFKSNTNADDYISDCSVDDIEDVFNDSTSSPLSTGLLPNTQMCAPFTENLLQKNIQNDDVTNKSLDVDHDSDSNNEVVSEDTGRASSLASSDIEKCFHSPDYFITNSPFSNGMIKDKRNYTDSSTSPITGLIERSDACTSPIAFSNKINGITFGDKQKQTKDIGIQVHLNDSIASTTATTNSICIKVQERGTSPLKIIQLDKALSPMKKDTVKIVASHPLKNIDEKTTSLMKPKQQDNIASPAEFDVINSNTATCAKEKQGLEINNSEVCVDNQDSDCEVENILRSVRFDYNLITPIPSSPAKEGELDNIESSEKYTCSDTARLNKKVDKLRESLGALTNYIFIKAPFERNLKVHPTTHNNKDNDIMDNIINDLAKPTENCEILENLLKNSALKSNCLSIPKPSDFEISSEIDKVQHEHQINNKSKDRIIGQEYTIKSSEIDKVHLKHQINNKSEDRIISQEYTIKSSEIDKVQHEHQINGKSEDRIISQEYTTKSPIKVTDKTKKTKKLTRLEKLRKKLLPRGKIRRALTPPIRKICRRNPLIFENRILKHSALPGQNNKTAYENAVKVMAEIRAKEKKKSINVAPCIGSVNNIITQEVHIVLSKCDEPAAQNKNIVSTAESQKAPAFIKSSVKPNTAVNSNSNVQDNITKISISKAPTNIVDSSAPLVLRRSKRLSSSASNNSDMTNRTEQLTTNEVQSSKQLKNIASDMLEGPCKKLKISKSPVRTNKMNIGESVNISPRNTTSKPIEIRRRSARLSNTQKNESQKEKDLTNHNTAKVITYNDLDIFSKQLPQPQIYPNNSSEDMSSFKKNILCRLIEKHGKSSVKWSMKKLPEKIIISMCQKLEDIIAKFHSSPNKIKEVMTNFIQDLRKCNMKIFLAGLMKYLTDPARKDEMYNKASILNSPPMTKSERALVHILKELRYFWRNEDFIEIVLQNIEYKLFKLNHTPEFGSIESMSHFYAVLCRYLGKLTRLRLFMIDAMYCVQFKSIAIIKQCTEVWMHILPLAHMGMAKSPIVICLVYLLHFFKCEDKFNRVQEIRSILSRKYFYKIYEWSEPNILEMLQNAIKELSDNEMEKKMLRMSLIIFAKRKGPQWCQKHIVNNMLLPLAREHGVSDKIKEFCISMLGPLLKPYPSIMKLQSESVFNELLVMLEKSVTPSTKEAILSSLLHMRHNPDRVHHILFKWNPVRVSAEFEQILADYITEKPAHIWKSLIDKIVSNTDKYDDCVNL